MEPDGSRIWIYVLLILVFALLKGVYSACEYAVTEVNDSKVKTLAETDPRYAKLLKLIEAPQKMMLAFSMQRALSCVMISILAVMLLDAVLDTRVELQLLHGGAAGWIRAGMRAGLLLVCALLAALLLSGCSGQKQAEYRADVQSGVSYLQSLETIDPDTVTQKLRQMRLEKLQAERAAREQALLDDIDTVWQEFSDAVILGDSRAVGFSYYSFLDASRVLASSGERIDAIDGHIEDLKKLAPAYIFLCYGINDLGWDGAAQDYAETRLEKIRLLRRELPEAVIVVSSILPAYEPAVSREQRGLQLPDYTAAVRARWEESGVRGAAWLPRLPGAAQGQR